MSDGLTSAMIQKGVKEAQSVFFAELGAGRKPTAAMKMAARRVKEVLGGYGFSVSIPKATELIRLYGQN